MSKGETCSYTWYGEATVDCDSWEEPVTICILICNGCGWTFYGDCFLNGPGFDYKGEQIPNYCPHYVHFDGSHGYELLGFGAIEQRPFFNAIKRLAQYEDIGSPEEFAELAKAKAEGRLVESAEIIDVGAEGWGAGYGQCSSCGNGLPLTFEGYCSKCGVKIGGGQ